MRSTHFYLLEIAFLGFKYHGYAIQPSHKTIQGQLEKTLRYVLGKSVPFKTLGCSRTDARVSAKQFFCELFLENALENQEEFLEKMQQNLPQDIQLFSVKKVNSSFNVINDVQSKSYTYTFTASKNYNVFNAPFLMHFRENLDCDKMQEAANIFVGNHNFSLFQKGKNEHSQFIRRIDKCIIEEFNQSGLMANCDAKVYRMTVTSKGFLRYQIRMMMGFMVEIGRGERSLEDLKATLKGETLSKALHYAVPGNALVLEKVIYND